MPIRQDFLCDIHQEMNWVKGHVATVGYVNALTIGGTTLSANLTNLWDPIANEGTMSVVGVMEYAFWEGGAISPISLSFAVDNSNQVTILNLLSAGLSNTVTSIQFTIYNFDQAVSPPCFYQTFWSDGASMNGMIAQQGTVLALEIERVMRPDIISPSLYNCHLSLAPTPGSVQPLYMANSSTSKYVSVFGTA